MSKTNHNIPKYAALYERLSREDGLEGQSNSIKNQITLLEKTAKEKGYYNFKHYTDDGCSGTNLQRPAMQQMLKDIKDGKVCAVIVKDASRLGRNYIEVGILQEDIFPEYDVRFISVMDGVDSKEGVDELSAYRNIMNQAYAQSTSKKLKLTNLIKGQQGIPLGRAPYGYRKKADGSGFWEIDETAAKTVRDIFSMALNGLGTAEIANILNERKIPSPIIYWESVGQSHNGRHNPETPDLWNASTVNSILSKREYCGDVINFKTYSKSFKSKKRYRNAPENIMVFENIHEPIIDRETFKIVNKNRSKSRKRKPFDYDRNIFSGLLVCADCGGNLNMHFNQGNHKILYFNCANYNNGKECTGTHYIRFDHLSKAVLADIKRLMKSVKADENAFVEYAKKCAAQSADSDLNIMRKKVSKLLTHKNDVDKLYEKIYEDNVMGKISDEKFFQLSSKYELEGKQLKNEIQKLQAELEKLEKTETNVKGFVDAVRKYTRAKILTAPMLKELIEKIVVHQSEKIDGVQVQHIDIYYRCIGKVDNK